MIGLSLNPCPYPWQLWRAAVLNVWRSLYDMHELIQCCAFQVLLVAWQYNRWPALTRHSSSVSLLFWTCSFFRSCDNLRLSFFPLHNELIWHMTQKDMKQTKTQSPQVFVTGATVELQPFIQSCSNFNSYRWMDGWTGILPCSFRLSSQNLFLCVSRLDRYYSSNPEHMNIES